MLLNILIIILLVTVGGLAFLVWRTWTRYDEINGAYTGLKLNAERLLAENGRLRGVQDRLGKRVREAESYELMFWRTLAADFDPTVNPVRRENRVVIEALREYRKQARHGTYGVAGLTAIGEAKLYHAAHDIEIVAAGWATVGDDGSRRDDTPRAGATQLP